MSPTKPEDIRASSQRTAEKYSFQCMRSGARFFLNASSGIIDISAPAKKYFEVKDHFCSAVPIVMYLKWAFASILLEGPRGDSGMPDC